MKQHETIANATDQPILPTTNASAELEMAGSANSETYKSKKDGNEQPNKWVVFAILAIGIFMATLDTSIVNISLPTIAHFFGVPLSGAVEWVIIAYLVVTAGVLLTVGRLADSIGRKPIWVAGLVIFTAGSAISGASVSLGIIGIIATLRVLRESANRGHVRFDPVGALLLAIGLVALTLGLSFGQQWGWNSPLLISTLVISALGFIGLIIVEQHVSNPIIDVVLLHSRVFLSANVSLMLSFLALFAVGFLLPFYLEELRGYSTLQAGLLLILFQECDEMLK
jgi:MFS family permease